MKGVDLMTQLINTGVKQSTGSKQDGSSDKDFEKMLEQAGQQQGFAAGTTADNSSGTSTTPTGDATTAPAAGEVEEPGTEELSIAAALITAQPMIPVDTFTPVEVEEVLPAAAEAILPQTDVTAEQATGTPLDIGMQQQQQEGDNSFGEAAAELTEQAEQIAEPAAEEAAAPEEHVEKAEHATQEQQPVEEDKAKAVDDASAAAEAPVFDHTEHVPVKVAETGEPVQAEAEDAAEQLAQRIQQAMAQGESRVEVTLTPENLGQLTVEITRSSDGALSIVLTTMTDKAAHLIDRHASSLQQMLMDHSQNVHIEVETRTPETQAQQFLNPDSQNNHQRQQQQQRQQKEEDHQDGDFLQQLRLGLVGMD